MFKKKSTTHKPIGNLQSRLNQVNFQEKKQKGKTLKIVCHKDVPLGILEEEYDQNDITKLHGVPSDILEMKVKKTTHITQIKNRIHKNLLAQCNCNGEVFKGNDFISHCFNIHSNYAPKGTHYNIPTIRMGIYWFDEDECLRFLYSTMTTIGTRKKQKA